VKCSVPPDAPRSGGDVVAVQIAIVHQRQNQEIGAALLRGVDGGALQETVVIYRNII
jgi:hypothetical protein